MAPVTTAPLLLLDSASMYFRAFHGLPTSVAAPDGTPVNAVRGFLDAVARLLVARRPARLVACWDDDWRPEFRVAALPTYKAHRVDPRAGDGSEAVPDELSPQVPVIVQALAALGIDRAGAPGHEADDVIGTLVAREAARAEPAPVEIVSGDRDLFQLVDDGARVRVLYPVRGQQEPAEVDQAWLADRYGVASGTAYAELATLRGDPSDGLPGVPGIGEKTAAALLATFGDLAALRAAAAAGDPRLTPAVRRRLAEAGGYLDVAPGVVSVVRDAPVPPLAGALPAAPADPAALEALARRWNLGSALGRVVDALTVLAAR